MQTITEITNTELVLQAAGAFVNEVRAMFAGEPEAQIQRRKNHRETLETEALRRKPANGLRDIHALGANWMRMSVMGADDVTIEDVNFEAQRIAHTMSFTF